MLRRVLVACPFCRELFDLRERTSCAVCGVALVAMDKLPPSADAQGMGEPLVLADEKRVPFTYLGRGRGLLATLALLGLAAFALPWVSVTLPDIVSYTGMDLGRRLGWAWAPGVAWFVLFPTVLSRRSLRQMRGARLAAAFLAAFPGLTALLLLARPPHASHGVPLRFTFGVGLYATMVLSALSVGVSLTFGGRGRAGANPDKVEMPRGSSEDSVLH
jgi:hypothetical protein